MFVCLLSWTHLLKKPSPFTHFFWHIFLQSPLIRTIWYRISRNLKKTPVFLHFSTIFVCLLSCFPCFLKFSLFVCLLSSFFLPFFLPLVKRTIILVFFFSHFQGFTSVPWQKVGRISSNSLVFSFLVCLLSWTHLLKKKPSPFTHFF